MKVYLEADFAKGRGAFRWEGVTLVQLRRLLVSALTLATAVTLVLLHLF